MSNHRVTSFAREMPSHLMGSEASRSSEKADQTQSRAISDDDTLRLIQQLFMTRLAPKVTVFAGVEKGNGCSEICASVGRMLVTHAQRKVCLVEANLRSPSLAAIFAVNGGPGLTDSLIAGEPIQSFARPIATDGLWLLPAGNRIDEAGTLLSSVRLPERLIELRQEFDFVIIDAPNLTEYSDAVALAQSSDGMVLVLEAGSTRRETALVVAASVRSAQVPILAAVLNKRTFSIPEMIYKHL